MRSPRWTRILEGQLVFGFAARGVADRVRERIGQVCADVGHHAGVELATYEAGTYGDLRAAVQRGEVDVAWLPPILFSALERERVVVPLVSAVREGALRFDAVLVVRRHSPYRSLADLATARAAWVDPHSASGYVFPRLELAASGIDLERLPSETFYHSHENVLRAVASGEADFGATHANARVSRAAEESLRILAQLGTLPPDVIAARSVLSADLKRRVARAFVLMSRDADGRALLFDAFGVEALRQTFPRGYDVLRDEAERGVELGLL